MSVVRIKKSTIERGIRALPVKAPETVKETVEKFVEAAKCSKAEMHELNHRMDSYINQVKYLETENNKLLDSIDHFRHTWGDKTRDVTTEYELSLCDMREKLDETAAAKTKSDIKKQRVCYENKELQYQIETASRFASGQANKISELEKMLGQIVETGSYLKQSISTERDDIERYRKNRDDTWNALVDLLDQLDDELYKRITVEYGNQTLREHIEFVKQINERELNEMAQLGTVLPFNEQIEFYKDQLKRVISNIRKDYEQLHLDQTREMEEWMKMKRVEVENLSAKQDPAHDLELNICLENIANLKDAFEANADELCELKRLESDKAKRLENLEKFIDLERNRIMDTLEAQEHEVERLKTELASLTSDVNHVNANKATLEYEINIYKRLLNSQTSLVQSQSANKPIEIVTKKSELSKKTTSQVVFSNETHGGQIKNFKGKIGFIEISDSLADGQFIKLSNESKTETLNVSRWTVKRNVDDFEELVFKIPSNTLLEPGAEFKIWGKEHARSASLGTRDLVAGFDCWGIGIKSSTRLIDTHNIEQAFFEHHILSFGELDSKLFELSKEKACVRRLKTAALITSWLMDFGILGDRLKSVAF